MARNKKSGVAASALAQLRKLAVSSAAAASKSHQRAKKAARDRLAEGPLGRGSERQAVVTREVADLVYVPYGTQTSTPAAGGIPGVTRWSQQISVDGLLQEAQGQFRDFERFRVNRVTIKYTPSVPQNWGGNVTICYDGDPSSDPPLSHSEAADGMRARQGPTTKSLAAEYAPPRDGVNGGWRYCTRPAQADGKVEMEDIDFSFGQVHVLFDAIKPEEAWSYGERAPVGTLRMIVHFTVKDYAPRQDGVLVGGLKDGEEVDLTDPGAIPVPNVPLRSANKVGPWGTVVAGLNHIRDSAGEALSAAGSGVFDTLKQAAGTYAFSVLADFAALAAIGGAERIHTPPAREHSVVSLRWMGRARGWVSTSYALLGAQHYSHDDPLPQPIAARISHIAGPKRLGMYRALARNLEHGEEFPSGTPALDAALAADFNLWRDFLNSGLLRDLPRNATMAPALTGDITVQLAAVPVEGGGLTTPYSVTLTPGTGATTWSFNRHFRTDRASVVFPSITQFAGDDRTMRAGSTVAWSAIRGVNTDPHFII